MCVNLVDYFWIIITMLGDEKFYVALIPFIYLAISMDLGIELALVFLAGMWLNGFLKYSLKLPRPPKEYWKISAKGYGFPSGHAQATTIFWGFFTLKKKRLGLALFSTILITLVGYSRVYLGVHYLHDVLGGAFFGLLTLLSYMFLKQRIRLSWNQKIYTGILVSSAMYTLSFLTGNIYDPTPPTLLGMSIGYLLTTREAIKLPGKTTKRILWGLCGILVSFGIYLLSHWVPDVISFILCYVLLGLAISYIIPKILSKISKVT